VVGSPENQGNEAVMTSATARLIGLAVVLSFGWLGGCATNAGGGDDDSGAWTPGSMTGLPGATTPGTGGSTALPGGGTPTTPAPPTGTGNVPPSGTGGAASPTPIAGTMGTDSPVGPVMGTGGAMAGTGGAMAGTGGMMAATGGTMAPPPVMGMGECCPDGNCLCHGPDPSALTSMAGPFRTGMLSLSLGTVHYPTDAEPPFAVVAICGGFLNTGPEMAGWGPFYASHGIVTIITTTTGGADLPDLRATKLLAALDQVKAENTKSGSALMGKIAVDRMGTSGYSMGGGGTTIASTRNKMLKTSVGLAPWGPVSAGITTPTLLLCGASDTVAPCNMAQSAYTGIPAATPKMMVTIPGTTHFNWFGPRDAGGGVSGSVALAFQKVFLEGDERWRKLLVAGPQSGTVQKNIQ
jgi:dienelactone hydrolase